MKSLHDFRLKPGQVWFRGARVSKTGGAPAQQPKQPRARRHNKH